MILGICRHRSSLLPLPCMCVCVCVCNFIKREGGVHIERLLLARHRPESCSVYGGTGPSWWKFCCWRRWLGSASSSTWTVPPKSFSNSNRATKSKLSTSTKTRRKITWSRKSRWKSKDPRSRIICSERRSRRPRVCFQMPPTRCGSEWLAYFVTLAFYFSFFVFFLCLVPSLRWRPRRSRHLWRPNGRPRRPGGPARARRPRWNGEGRRPAQGPDSRTKEAGRRRLAEERV